MTTSLELELRMIDNGIEFSKGEILGLSKSIRDDLMYLNRRIGHPGVAKLSGLNSLGVLQGRGPMLDVLIAELSAKLEHRRAVTRLIEDAAKEAN